MQMSEDNVRRLNRALRWRRMKTWGGLMGLALLIVVPYLAMTEYRAARVDVTMTRTRIDGTVVDVRPAGRGPTYAVDVRLANGQVVEARSLLKVAPIKGARVVVDDAGHRSGRHTYEIARINR